MIGYHAEFFQGLSALIASLGVLSTGLAAIISAILSSRAAKRKAESECDRRIAELAESFHAGMRLADSRPRRRRGDKPHAN